MEKFTDILEKLRLHNCPESVLSELKHYVQSKHMEIDFLKRDMISKNQNLLELKRTILNSSNYLNKLINTIPEPVFVKDENHNWVLINKALCDFLGTDINDMLGKSDYDFFPKEQADIFWEKDNEVLYKGTENINEEVITDSQGNVKSITTTKVLFTDLNGRRFIIAFIRDTSDIKRADAKRLDYELRMDFLSKSAIDFINLNPEDSFYDLVSKHISMIAGDSIVTVSDYCQISNALKPKALIGMPKLIEYFSNLFKVSFYEKHYPINDDGFKNLITGNLEEATGGLYQLSMFQLPKAQCRIMENLLKLRRFYGIGMVHKNNLLGSILIVTRYKKDFEFKELIEAYTRQASVVLQKRKIEQALTTSEERYRQIFENIQSVYYEATLEGIITEVSPSIKNYALYERHELIGKSVNEIYADANERNKLLDLLLAYGKASNYELRLKDKDGRIKYCSVSVKLSSSKENEPVKIIGSLIDITELKQKSLELIKTEKKYEELLTNIGEGVAIVDKDGIIVYANPAAENIFAAMPNDLLGKNFNDMIVSSYKLPKPHLYKGNITNKNSYEIDVKRNDGQLRNLLITSTIRYNQKGEQIGTFVIFRDLTSKKRINEALKHSEQKFRELFHNANDIIYTVDFDANITSVNPSAIRLLGFDANEILYKSIKKVITQSSFNLFLSNIQSILKKPDFRSVIEMEFVTKNGNILYFETNNILRYRSGNPFEIFGIARNISDRITKEQVLKTSIAEKEVLLKEVHHRVKNNLQVIISLISFQIQKQLPPEITGNLLDLQNRIRSIALIHQDLYRSDNFSSVNLRNYINQLLNNLMLSANMESQVETIIEMDEVFIDMQTAIPCGMIINELVSNAIKYAFPENLERKPFLRIVFNYLQAKEYELVVEDNGIGFDMEFIEKRKSKSIGLWLVKILANDQLMGDTDIKSSPLGTYAKVSFKLQ